MKANKSPENKEVTPSKKKLTQARLPFKIISEVSPKPESPTSRKRKLSAPETETLTKVGKISNENDIDDLVVISDEDSKDDQKSTKVDKTANPFVKLVDTAWKKKLQKSKKKLSNKKKTKELTNVSIESAEGKSSETGNDDEVEMMDVDVPSKGAIADFEIKENNKGMATDTVSNPSTIETKNKNIIETEQVVILEDSCDANYKNGEEFTKQDSDPQLTDSENITETNSPVTQSEQKNKQDLNLKHDISIKQLDKEESPEPSMECINSITPKRSARNIAKAEEKTKLNSSTSSSKLDESVCANVTPKQNRSLSVTNSQGDESINESTGNAKLTPKQVQKKLESAKKREEREKDKQEREKKRQQEKEEKAKQRQEKEEQKRKEREEKEEARRKEKEEKEKQRELEKKLKEEKEEQKRKEKEEKEEQKKKEREEKEEQRRKEKEARDEEKRKKQETLEQEKFEQELKKKKAAEAFANFFVPKQKSEKDQATVGPSSQNNILSSFTIKIDMRLAPIVRTDFDEVRKQKMEDSLKVQNTEDKELYLKSLKDGSKTGSCGKTWPLDDKNDDDDVMFVEDELPPDVAGEIITCESTAREKLRPKLLSFYENRRPPYWGTWRKKSAFIKPRRPFEQDEKQLEYEVDSDEEWEEEQEGESIDGSAAGSDDEQDGDEYEVDNEVFVPHGYLSDEEATMDEDDVLSLSPETQKAKLKLLEDEFESEMKKPTEKLKPRLYGLLWESQDGAKPEKCVDALWSYFGKLSMIMNDPTSLLQPTNDPDEAEKKKVKKKKTVAQQEQDSPKSEKKKKAKSENKEQKTPKTDTKKSTPDVKKNQLGINSFLKKIKT